MFNVPKGYTHAERGEPPMRQDFPAGTSPGRTEVVGGQAEGCRAEAVVVVRWMGRNGQKNLCWLNRVLLQTPAGKPLFLSFSSPLWRAGVCQGHCQGCRVPLWLWDVPGLSTLCLRASGRRLAGG